MKPIRSLLVILVLGTCALTSGPCPSAAYNMDQLKAAFQQGQWIDDVQAAEGYSVIVHRPVLALFTGSDWCAFCKKLEADVLSQSLWKERVRGRYVLLYLDFPRSKKVPPDVAQQRRKLADQYQVKGFPTMVVLTGGDKAVGQVRGFIPGTTPEQYIGKIEAIAAAIK